MGVEEGEMQDVVEVGGDVAPLVAHIRMLGTAPQDRKGGGSSLGRIRSTTLLWVRLTEVRQLLLDSSLLIPRPGGKKSVEGTEGVAEIRATHRPPCQNMAPKEFLPVMGATEGTRLSGEGRGGKKIGCHC